MKRARKNPRAERDERGEALRRIPAVSRVKGVPAWHALARQAGPALATDLVREELDAIRTRVLAGGIRGDALRRAITPAAVIARAREAARVVLAPSPRTVINATGIVVHTNLGRSLLSEDAARRLSRVSAAYMDLEYDLAGASRGSRSAHLEPVLARLFPGRAAAAFNNNAAAILIALRALAQGKEVIVSRGELVEIGGSFRVPEILSASGARLREVGTTNRTRVADYESALSPRTGLLLKVHTSNFKIVGFAEETSIASLAALARRAGVPLVVDWGSGDLVDLGPLGIHDEMPVRAILEAGADLVTFSGDKLLGGPQAGLVIGREDLVARMRRDPMARVCRLDRLLICALRETLVSYLRGRAFQEVPTLRMLALGPEEIGRRAEVVARQAGRGAGASSRLSLIAGVSRTGGGSSPTGERPTRLLAVEGLRGDAGFLERALRVGDPPVIGRIHEGKLLLDLRTVIPSQDRVLARRLGAALREEAGVKRSGGTRGRARRATR